MKNTATAIVCSLILSAGVAIGLGAGGSAGAAGPSVNKQLKVISEKLGEADEFGSVLYELRHLTLDLRDIGTVVHTTCVEVGASPCTAAITK